VKTSKRPVISEEEQRLLEGVRVRLIRPDERERFDQFLLLPNEWVIFEEFNKSG
jgi:hypothetical protein